MARTGGGIGMEAGLNHAGQAWSFYKEGIMRVRLFLFEKKKLLIIHYPLSCLL